MTTPHIITHADAGDPNIYTLVEYTNNDGDRCSLTTGDDGGLVSPHHEQYEGVYVFTLFEKILDNGDDVVSSFTYDGDIDYETLADRLELAAVIVRQAAEVEEISELLDDIENNHEDLEV